MSADLPRFNRLAVGDSACVERRFSPGDIDQWCDLAAVEPPWAGVPEPLIAGLFSCLLGEQLPGHGTNYLKQDLAFVAEARAGESLRARVTITRLRPDKALVNLATTCTGDQDRLICEGEALVLFQH